MNSLKLKKMGGMSPYESLEEVPDDYKPLCPQLGEHVVWMLKDVVPIKVEGFGEVTSMLLDRIEQLEATVEKLIKNN